MKKFVNEAAIRFIAVVCAAILVSWTTFAAPPPAVWQEPPATAQEQPKKIASDQLDALVHPVAFLPDVLLTKTLTASTFPLELVQLHQWLEKNEKLKGKKLEEAVAQQPWDSSVRALASSRDVVKELAGDIQWTADLGNAFLAQQIDVADAVQRVRLKAKDSGALKSNSYIKVKTKTVEGKKVIVVEKR